MHPEQVIEVVPERFMYCIFEWFVHNNIAFLHGISTISRNKQRVNVILSQQLQNFIVFVRKMEVVLQDRGLIRWSAELESCLFCKE